MARKHKRRKRLNAGPVLWLLVVASVGLGLFLSPITAAGHIRVVGAKPSDLLRIERELQWLKDKPCLNVNGASVEEQILRRPDVQRAELSQNVFGRGELRLTYYEAVARVGNLKNVVLTNAGFLCSMRDGPVDLPTLDLFPGADRMNLAISAQWEPQRIAEICERAGKEGIVKNLSITVTVGGSVCLNSGVTGRVVLGAPDDLDEKFEKMRAILASQPNLLSTGKELVLTAPSKPVTRPLQGNPQ